jgi:hypothetical protein
MRKQEVSVLMSDKRLQQDKNNLSVPADSLISNSGELQQQLGRAPIESAATS